MTTVPGIPTLLQTRSFQSAAADLRTRIIAAQQEATTGEIADLSKALRGDVGRVQKLEKAIADNNNYLQAISIAETRYATAQNSLSQLASVSNLVGVEIAASVGQQDQTSLAQQSRAAEGDFITIVSGLNASVGGRALFSGAATNVTPIQDAQTILSDIATIVTTAPDLVTAQNNINAYFAPGGTFETTIYQGDLTLNAPSAEVAPGRRVGPDVKAIDPEIVQVLQGLATVAVAFDAAPNQGISNGLLDAAASSLIDGSRQVLDTQSRLGAFEEQLRALRARNETETFGLEQALAALTTRDQFDASTELQALTLQLESVFVTTSRIANLSLTNFLR